MESKQKLFSINFLLISLVFISVNGDDVCVAKGPCRCEFSNGTGIDLTDAAKSSFYAAQDYEMIKNANTTQIKLSTYYYHPCIDVLPKDIPSTTVNTCIAPLALCRNVKTMNADAKGTTFTMDQGQNDYLGTSNFTVFGNDGRSIVYEHPPSTTNVLLVCAETEGVLHILSLEDPNNLTLQFYSKSACLKQLEEPGRSFGSTLCIILFTCVIFYLVLGICTKKFLMGATGVEVIPNLAFWSDLPNLVKDGWAFAISGFKLPSRGPVATPDPNSYDSI